MFTVTEHLIKTIRDSRAHFIIIQLVPETANKTQTLICQTEEKTLEIGLTKKTYLSIFKEAHTHWHELNTLDIKDYLERASEKEVWELYLMTLGYLISTNENHTIFNIHELVVMKLYYRKGRSFLLDEFNIMTSFASSRLKKINKSSSLWFWIKKLTLLLVFSQSGTDEESVTLYRKLIDRTLKSASLHFANYYAFNFFRWLHQLNCVLGYKSINQYMLEELLLKCHQSLKDVSVWDTLLVVLLGEPKDFRFAVEEYNYIAHAYSLNEIQYEEVKMKNNEELILRELSWLLNVKCPYETPYISLINATRCLPNFAIQLLGQIKRNYDAEHRTLELLKDSNASIYAHHSTYVNLLALLLQKNRILVISE
ncbi:uncharacterized protein PRCAT00004871001 [Priceomyces carsonii]|uniref:uncharacterized protein n=1 Tax=Priceomyces carsonii TaxID=28549 RepID=UPI002ED79EE6|nr:unnamed protein product [Priceomyces carsonii]